MFRELKSRGYDMVLIHPELETFEGSSCFWTLKDIHPKVNATIINVNKEHTKTILEDAHQAGIHNIWLQQGSESPESIQYAKSLNMNIISGKCILMYAESVKSVHAFHRFVWKLLKQY
jgi:hypothetical protein